MAKSTLKSKAKVNPKGGKKFTPVIGGFQKQNSFKVNGTLPNDNLYRHPEVLHFIDVQTAMAPHPRPVDISTLKSPADNSAINAVLQAIPMSSLLIKHHLSTPIKKGNPGVIAILDTGVNAKHQDLRGRVLHQMNYKGETDPEKVIDLHGHGTHMAGIVCGKQRSFNYKPPRNYGLEMTRLYEITDTIKITTGGINQDAKIVSVKVTEGDEGHTSWQKITMGLKQVIDYNELVSNEDKVTCVLIAYNGFDNVSKTVDVSNELMAERVNLLYGMKIPVVVSAGNMFEFFTSGGIDPTLSDGLAYPAYMRNVFAAGAINAEGSVAEFSQRVYDESPNYTGKFICVYGDQTVGPGITAYNSYTMMRGSSVSAAVLAGSITLMQARYSAKNHGERISVDSIFTHIMLRSGRTAYYERGANRRVKTMNLNACLLDMSTI